MSYLWSPHLSGGDKLSERRPPDISDSRYLGLLSFDPRKKDMYT